MQKLRLLVLYASLGVLVVSVVLLLFSPSTGFDQTSAGLTILAMTFTALSMAVSLREQKS